MTGQVLGNNFSGESPFGASSSAGAGNFPFWAMWNVLFRQIPTAKSMLSHRPPASHHEEHHLNPLSPSSALLSQMIFDEPTAMDKVAG